MVSKPGPNDAKSPGGKGKASWRSGRSAKGRNEYAWQESTASKANQAVQRRNYVRRFAVAGLFLLFVGLCIYFFLVTFRKPLKVPLVALAVTNYDLSSIPPNSFAAEDLANLERMSEGQMFAVTAEQDTSTRRDSALALLEQQLKVKPGGPGKDTVIVYLSAHGVVGYPTGTSGQKATAGFEQPQPCLLFSAADALDSSNWLPLSEVFSLLTNYDAKVNKVLILDCGRIDTDWRLGQLYNGFADLLPEAVRAANVPGLVVINSAGPGQMAWSAPELNASVFGHFVTQGLLGAANDPPYGNDDRIVSFQELAKYLETSVSQWTRNHRSEIQEPQILSTAGELPDFSVAFATPAGSRPKADQPAAPGDDRRWQDVARLWETHSELSNGDAPVSQPLTWATYQQSLLRLERLLHSGSAYADSYERLKRETDRLADQLRSVERPVLPSVSLPILARYGQNDALRGSDAQRVQPTTAAKLDPMAPYLQSAASLWTQATSKSGVPKQSLAADLQVLAKASGKPELEPIEIHFLRMINQYLDPNVAQTGPGFVQQAIAARDAAEKAAAPSDPRVQYVGYQSINAGDAARRQAEDNLFVGSQQELTAAAKLWSQSTAAYSQAIERCTTLADAYELRDRAFLELPYLVQWSHRRIDFDPAFGGELNAIAGDTHKLAGLLDQATGNSIDPEIKQLHDSLRERLGKITTAFQSECDWLRSVASDSAENLYRMHIVLDTPLLTGGQRNELRKEYLNILARVEEPSTTASPSDTSADEARQRVASRMNRLKMADHPALVLLSRDSIDPSLGRPNNTYVSETLYGKSEEDLRGLGDLTWVKVLSAQGDQVRQLLVDLPNQVEEQRKQTDELLKTSNPAPAASRTGLCKSDHLLRAAAAIKGNGPWHNGHTDPIADLRLLDLHNLMVLHAGRAVEDFWDSLDSSKTPYFQLAAEACLARAGQLVREARTMTTPVSALLAERVAAAQTGLTPKPENMLFAEGDSRREHKVPIAWPDHLPVGQAAYLVKDGETKPVPLATSSGNVARLPLGLKPTAAEVDVSYELARSELAETGSTFEAAVLYRGHFYPRPFEATPIGRGIEIVHTPGEYADPTITVSGDARRRSAIMFVFDCSSSMYEARKGESNRLEIAKETLNRVLAQLDGKFFDVGLRVYGHRAGWNGKVYNPKTGYAILPSDPKYAGIKPGLDVELVLPLGKFTDDERKKVSKFLERLKPHGETPLYLAITQAAEDLKRHPEKGIKRVIAITDGLNRQTRDGSNRFEPRTNEKDVREALADQGIRLDIVGFRVTPQAGDADEQTAAAFLKSIPTETGGQFYSADDSETLLAALERSLGLSQFEVYSGKTRIGQPTDLGSTLRIEDHPSGQKELYTIKLSDRQRPAETNINLEGGEAIELALVEESGRRELVHQRYKKPSRDVAVENIPDPDPSSDRKIYIAAHLPEESGNLTRFEISLQDQDARKLLPRPAEAWVEIKPDRPDPAHPERSVFHFYDMKFVPDRPVPVLGCEVLDWPQSDAQIRVWMKMAKTDPDATVALRDQWNREFQLPQFPGTKFKMQIKPGETLGVEITETHDTDDGLYSLKVELDHKADKIVHSYNPEIRSATHTFYFRRGGEDLVRDYEVQLTSRQKLMDRAITTPEPLQRTVSRR